MDETSSAQAGDESFEGATSIAPEPPGPSPMMPPFPLPSESWLTLVRMDEGPPLVWSTSATRTEAEQQARGDLGGKPTTWLIERDRPELDIWFRDAAGGPAWLVSRTIWFQRHAKLLALVRDYIGTPVPAWFLNGWEGEITDPFQGHAGGTGVIFPWPQGQRLPACPWCRKPLTCLAVIDGEGAPGWFTTAPGALVILICPEHWYEEKARVVRWVERAQPSEVKGSLRSAVLLAYIPDADHPPQGESDHMEEPPPGTERLGIERLYDFLIYHGNKLGGLPHWIQDDETPIDHPRPGRSPLAFWTRRRQWRFLGQVSGTTDIELGDSGLLYLWRDAVHGDFTTRVQCY